MKISFSNFPQELTEEELQKIFQKYGTIQKFHLKKDKITKKSLGYGTLEMEDADGKKAIEELNGKDWNGKVVSVANWEELQQKFNDSSKSSSQSQDSHSNKVLNRKNFFGGGGSNIMRRGGTRGS